MQSVNRVINSSSIETIFQRAFDEMNQSLHKSAIDDTLSGTTGIVVVIKGDVLYIGNVGDSRAIIASDINGSCKFSALSNDQTPFRPDERVRLRARGAYVMSMDQIDGYEEKHDNWGLPGVPEVGVCVCV